MLPTYTAHWSPGARLHEDNVVIPPAETLSGGTTCARLAQVDFCVAEVQWQLADAREGSVDAELASLGRWPPLGRKTVSSIAERATVLNLQKATARPSFLSQISRHTTFQHIHMFMPVHIM